MHCRTAAALASVKSG